MLDKNAMAQLRQLKQQIVDSKPVLDGVIRGTQWRYGFVMLDDGKQLLVPGDEMNKVFPGDRVSIEIRQDEKGKDVAFIDKLLESNFKRLTGQIITKGNNSFVSPDVQNLSRWLFVPPSQLQGAKAGDYVEAAVLKHPFRNEGKAQVRIERVIGAADERGIERTYTISKFQLDGRFPENVIESLPALCAERLQQTEGRENLDDVFFITIDGEESRDLDDALFVEANDNGWRLLVAIADASHFVTPNSDIDRIARKRGTSTYLPGRVLPMLPEALSNEACSLLEGQQRLAIVCEMQIGHDGVTASQRIFEATIVSKKRLSYETAQTILDGHPDAALNADNSLTSLLQTLNQLRAALFERRRSQYLAMEERPDFKLETDIDGRLTAIKRIDRNDAHRIVEECMLAANRAACDFLLQHKLPALFIAHTGFRSERHENVRQLIASQYPDKKDVAFNELSGYIELIRHIEQHPTEVPVYTLLSRQLERSQITLTPAPHFGMGLPFYTTFTSPIRKYIDLSVHRVIKAFLRQDKAGHKIDTTLTEQLQEAIQRAKQSSRELEQWLKCIYLKPHAGRSFRGEIMQIGSRNIGVYLDEFDCNGHIDVKTLNDKFQFDAVTSELRCGDKVFRLHQKVDVDLVDVNPVTRQITLQLKPAEAA